MKNENVDHIYCNKLNNREKLPYSEKSNFIGDDKTVKKMKNFILSNINLIEELQNQLSERDQLISKLLAENESLKQRLQRYKHSKSSNKKCSAENSKESNNNTNTNNNNNLPAIRNKSEKSQKDETSTSKQKRKSIETSEDEHQVKKRSEDSQESISIKLSNKNLFLMTNKEYTINHWKTCDIDNEEEFDKTYKEGVCLEVPRWKEFELPASPTKEIENLPAEDISDEAIQKRHLKYEADERRRKKWDQQRIREQKNIERLKKRHLKEEYAEMMSLNNKVKKSMTSFFPDIKTIKFIQISDDLPICAFGQQIPKLTPKDFSLPWMSEEVDNSNVYTIDNITTSNGSKVKVRSKFVRRCSNAK